MGWKKDAAQASQRLLEQQYKFQEELLKKRESQRDQGISAMNQLMGMQPKYTIPESVNQYVGLMNSLGGELSAIRDPSNKSDIDFSQYATTPKNYEQAQLPTIDPGKSVEDMYNASASSESRASTGERLNNWIQKNSPQESWLDFLIPGYSQIKEKDWKNLVASALTGGISNILRPTASGEPLTAQKGRPPRGNNVKAMTPNTVKNY